MNHRLTAAAAELLEESGLPALTIREVARRCGVSHGAPRRYFPSLAALQATVARRGFADLSSALSEAGESLEAQANAYVTFAQERPETFDLMYRHDLLEGSGEQLRETSLPLVREWVDRYRHEHPAAGAADALAAWAGVHGVATLVSRRALSLIDITPEELVRAVLR